MISLLAYMALAHLKWGPILPNFSFFNIVEKYRMELPKNLAETMPDKVVLLGDRNNFNYRRRYANKVENIFRYQSGIHNNKIITAILVNMWAESNWYPRARLHHCMGLFQLHIKYDGAGLTYNEITSIIPHVNRVMSLPQYQKWRVWALTHADRVTCGKIAYEFARQVERCEKSSRYPRYRMANNWFAKINANS